MKSTADETTIRAGVANSAPQDGVSMNSASDKPTRGWPTVALDIVPLLLNPTGVGMLARHLVAGLAEAGQVDVVGYAMSFRGRDNRLAALPPNVRLAASSPARPLMALWRWFGRPRYDPFVRGVDVVHGTNFIVPPLRSPASIVTVHDLTPLRYPQFCGRETLRFPQHLEWARKAGSFAHVTCQTMAGEVASYLRWPTDRIAVASPGVPSVLPADAAQGRELAGGRPYVLALGTIEPRKNLPVLLRAFDEVAAHTSDVVLVVAGADGWGSVQFDRTLSEMRHAKRVVRLGYVTDEQRAALLRGARALAYPSRYEGYGFPALEAMSVGVPVISTAVGSLPEVLGDAAVLVGADDVAALAAGLQTVIDDEGARSRLVEAGRARTAELSWDRFIGEMTAIYEALTRRSDLPAAARLR